MMDLDVGVVSEVEKKQKKKLLLDYLYDNLKNHNWWAYRYFFCELLAFVNVLGTKLPAPAVVLYSTYLRINTCTTQLLSLFLLSPPQVKCS